MEIRLKMKLGDKFRRQIKWLKRIGILLLCYFLMYGVLRICGCLQYRFGKVSIGNPFNGHRTIKVWSNNFWLFAPIAKFDKGIHIWGGISGNRFEQGLTRFEDIPLPKHIIPANLMPSEPMSYCGYLEQSHNGDYWWVVYEACKIPNFLQKLLSNTSSKEIAKVTPKSKIGPFIEAPENTHVIRLWDNFPIHFDIYLLNFSNLELPVSQESKVVFLYQSEYG